MCYSAVKIPDSRFKREYEYLTLGPVRPTITEKIYAIKVGQGILVPLYKHVHIT